MEEKKSKRSKSLGKCKTKEEFFTSLNEEASSLREQMRVLLGVISNQIYAKNLELTDEETIELKKLGSMLNSAECDVSKFIITIEIIMKRLNKKDSSKDDIINP